MDTPELLALVVLLTFAKKLGELIAIEVFRKLSKIWRFIKRQGENKMLRTIKTENVKENP